MLVARNVAFCFVATQLLPHCFKLSLSSPVPEPTAMVTQSACFGQPTEIRCHTSLLKPIDFFFRSNENDTYDDWIVLNGRITDAWRSELLAFTRHDNGTYVLKILNVQLDDVGFYRCREDGGLGSVISSVFLNVSRCDAAPEGSTTTTSSCQVPIIVSVFATTLAALLVFVFCFVVWRCRKRRTHRSQHKYELQKETREQKSEVDTYQTPETTRLTQREQRHHFPVVSSNSSDSSTSDATDAMFLESVKETCRGERVRSVCVVDNRLYVARFKQTHIEVYDAVTMEPTDKLMAAGDQYGVPTSLAADETEKVIYIAYYDEKLMRTHWLNDARKDGFTWQTDSKPEHISVTSDHTIIATFKRERKLTEYQSDGTVLLEIHLERDVFYPRCAVPIIKNVFVICYGKLGKTCCGMCLVNNDGNIINHVITKTTLPRHVSVGADRTLFITDHHDGNVVVLDNNFQYTAALLHKLSGINQPFTSCLDSSRQRIYIGEVSEVPGDSRVMSFNICCRSQLV